MPEVTISNTALADLGTLRYWFKASSPGETIERIVQNTMNRLGIEADDQTEEPVSPTAPNDKTNEVALSLNDVLCFDTSPNLTFSKPVEGIIDNKRINNPKWATLLYAVIAAIKNRGLEGERLVQELSIASRSSKYNNKIYKYVSELGISIDEKSAIDLWKEIDRLAQKWTIPVEIKVVWKNTPLQNIPAEQVSCGQDCIDSVSLILPPVK